MEGSGLLHMPAVCNLGKIPLTSIT